MAVNIDVLPHDAHNDTLVANVHPSSWVNPEPAPCYNLVVIGGGTAGLISAAGAAGLGAKVALIERYLLGGDCLNVGCVPSKGVIRASRALHDARTSAEFGIQGGAGLGFDFGTAMERMRRLRADISQHDSARRFRDELGVDVFIGQGSFSGRTTVEVAGKTLRFKKAAVCTGARAAAPPIPGLEEAGYLTNETIFLAGHHQWSRNRRYRQNHPSLSDPGRGHQAAGRRLQPDPADTFCEEPAFRMAGMAER